MMRTAPHTHTIHVHTHTRARAMETGDCNYFLGSPVRPSRDGRCREDALVRQTYLYAPVKMEKIVNILHMCVYVRRVKSTLRQTTRRYTLITLTFFIRSVQWEETNRNEIIFINAWKPNEITKKKLSITIGLPDHVSVWIHFFFRAFQSNTGARKQWAVLGYGPNLITRAFL